MNLTPDQRRAVERTGQNVCVVAGPGAGKTRVLIERFAWLVEQRQIDPARILAITFTEKAATEIKERLVERFAARPELREAIESAWVSTIDGFCTRLLRENAIAAGIAPDFDILDQARADRLQRESAEAALDQLFEEHPAKMRRLLEALDLSTQDEGRQPDLARGLLDVYEAMRLADMRELPPSGVVNQDVFALARSLVEQALADSPGKTEVQRSARARFNEWAAEFLALAPSPITLGHFRVLENFDFNLNHFARNTVSRIAVTQLKQEIVERLESQFLAAWNHDLQELLREAITRIGAVYRGRKRRDSALDFGDLEEQSIALLESDVRVRQETVERFDHVLMDELQDTNRLQWRLLDLLISDVSSGAGRSHAAASHNVANKFFAVGDINQSIYGFRHAEPVVFEEYRTGLQALGHIIDDLRDNHRSRAEILDTVSRMLDGQQGIEARPLTAAREWAPAPHAVVELLVGQGEFAAEAEAGLVAERIRQLAADGYKYSNIAILVRSLIALERFERALDRFDIPFLVGGGRTFLEAREIRDLLMLLAALVNPLDDIAVVGVLRGPLAGVSDEEIFRMGAEGRRRRFNELFGRLRPLAGFVSPDRLATAALDESDYFSGLAPRARANIEKLLAWIRRETTDRPRPLAELLEDLETLRTMQSEAEAPPPEAGDAVSLMSIHAAKGLEFPVVFVSALHRRPDAHKPVIGCSPAIGLGAKWRNPVTGKGQSDPAHAALTEQWKRNEAAEENRLLYVAMTRAEDRLILSYSERQRASNWQKLASAAIPAVTLSDQPPSAPSMVSEDAGSAADELVDPPVVSGQHDASAAVTALALFHACPRRYFLGRYLGVQPRSKISVSVGAELDVELPAESDEDDAVANISLGGAIGAMTLGSTVHALLAGGPATDATLHATPEAFKLAARFTASEWGQRAARVDTERPAASRLEREFDFLLHCEGVVLRGQIDLWFEEGGELVLVDYKTDRDETLSDGYALQLRIYALTLERYAGRLPDRAFLFYLRSGTTVNVALSGDELETARAAVRDFKKAQETSAFPLHIGEHCRRCPYYRGLCPARL